MHTTPPAAASRRATPVRAALLAATLLLTACAGQTATTRLPPIATSGPDSAVINVIYGADAAFRDPAALAGRPADAAVAMMRLEWLAEETPRDLTFRDSSSITAPALGAARGQLRQVLGIAADAPAQQVIDGLGAALPALQGGNQAAERAALPAPTFSPETPARLAALPRVAQANAALQRLIRDLEFGRDDNFPLALGPR